MGPGEPRTHLQELHHVQLGVGLLLLRRGLAEQLGRVHLVPLVVLSCDTRRGVRTTRHSYGARDPGRGGSGQGLLRLGAGQLWVGLWRGHRSWRADCPGKRHAAHAVSSSASTCTLSPPSTWPALTSAQQIPGDLGIPRPPVPCIAPHFST